LSTPAIATPPIKGHGLKIVYPPSICVPASFAHSVNPFNIKEVITSYSFGFISREMHNTIKILSIFSTPIAYKSDKTLQHAILP